MDEEAIRARIAGLKATKEAVEKADTECLSALESLRQALLSIRAMVPESELLDRPIISERTRQTDTKFAPDDDLNWHECSAPRMYCPGLGSHITYNPLRRTWAWELNHAFERVERDQIISTYGDRLATWVVHDYPAAKQAHDDEQRHVEWRTLQHEEEQAKNAQADAKRAQEEAASDAMMDDYFRDFKQKLGWGCFALVVLIPALSMCVTRSMTGGH